MSVEIKLIRKHSDDNWFDEYSVNGKAAYVIKDAITLGHKVKLDDFEMQCFRDVVEKAKQGIYLQQSTYTRPYEQNVMLTVVD
jgi:hypothetical protein